jgi:ATP/maltotriose-dependent transcriptional regulator MalT
VAAGHPSGTSLAARPFEIPILLTRLAIPSPRPVRVLRPRLTARLDQASNYRMAVVIAPAGSGKSSLLSEWCHLAIERGEKVAWLSLESGDNDPARFLLYVINALNQVVPELGEDSRSPLSSSQRPPLDGVLTALLNELSTLESSVTLILDDYHAILSDAVHELVETLLEHAPAGVRPVIASRAEPPLPLSRWRVRGQLMELRASELRFTGEEATAFLNEVMGLALEPEAVARLEARTEGWIAGLQLAALSLQGRADAAGFLDQFTGSNRYVADYLFDEVLSRQPEPVQEFLVQTSMLDRLCGPLCDSVTGRTGSQALLERLESANLFLIPLDEERRWYRYHHLFADVLRARLQQASGDTAELHGRAALWYEKQELVEEAVHHALAGDQTEHATRLIEEHVPAVWGRGERHTVETWLQALPEERIRASPLLTIHLGVVYYYNHQIAAMEDLLYGGRFEEPVDTEEARDVKGRLLALRGHLARLQGNTQHALALSHEALSYLSAAQPVWRNAAQLNLGLLHHESGDLNEANEALTAAIAGSRTGRDFHILLASSIARGRIPEAQGALREADDWYRSLLQMAAERKALQFPEVALVYAGLGRLRYNQNDLPGAETYLMEGLKRKHPNFTASCLMELLKVRNAQKDRDGVAAVLAQLEQAPLLANQPWLSDTITALRVRMGLSRDEEARTWMEWYEAEGRERTGFRLPLFEIREFEELTWAQVCQATGRSQVASARLDALLQQAVQQGRHGAALAIRVFLALLHQEAGRGERAVALLEPALTLAETEGYRRVFLDAGSRLVPVLRQAAAQGIVPEFVGEVLAAFRDEGLIAGAPPPRESPQLAYSPPLSERELEVLRLVAAGLSNTEIAQQLFLSVGTVKRHLSNISSKLDATSRSSAVARARALGVL